MQGKYIQRAWTNYSQPGSLKALSGFAKARSLKPDKKTDKELSNIEAYSVHRPVRQHYPTRATIIRAPRKLFFTDLIDLQAFSRQNKGFSWIIVVIDGFTKEAFVEKLKKKTTKETADAFERILKRAKKAPKDLYSDMGLEYTGSSFQKLMKKHKINHYTSKTKRKSFQAERFIRTLKSSIFKHFTQSKGKRWVDVLDDIVKAYNNTKHTTTLFKPSEIREKDWGQVFLNLHKRLRLKKDPAPKYKVGDRVRLAKNRVAFQKGYVQSFGPDVLRIKSIVPFSHPVPTYKLETLDGFPVSSSFVANEIGYANQNGKQ